MSAPTVPTVRIQLANGTHRAGDLLALASSELTIAFPGECGTALETGRRVAVVARGGDPEANAPANVLATLDHEELGAFATLRLTDPRRLAGLGLGPAGEPFNQRDAFRTPVALGSAGRTTIVGLDGRGQVRMRTAVEAHLIDVSLAGAGLLVAAPDLEQLAIWPQVRVDVDVRIEPEGERPLRILGTIKHQAEASQGARLGVEVGGPGVRWTPADEARLRAFVQEQQRLALARRRQPR